MNLCQGLLIETWIKMDRSLKKNQGQAIEKKISAKAGKTVKKT